jgi:hypothetical protein
VVGEPPPIGLSSDQVLEWARLKYEQSKILSGRILLLVAFIVTIGAGAVVGVLALRELNARGKTAVILEETSPR